MRISRITIARPAGTGVAARAARTAETVVAARAGVSFDDLWAGYVDAYAGPGNRTVADCLDPPE